MEPQRPSQYPFLRMQPFSAAPDTRKAPLPPPPYSAPSPSSHNNPTLVYDPFRNREADGQRRTQTPPFSTQTRGANGAEYVRQPYTGPSGKPQGVAHDTHMRHSSYGSGSLFGGHGESVRGQIDGEGEHSSILQFRVRLCHHYPSTACAVHTPHNSVAMRSHQSHGQDTVHRRTDSVGLFSEHIVNFTCVSHCNNVLSSDGKYYSRFWLAYHHDAELHPSSRENPIFLSS